MTGTTSSATYDPIDAVKAENTNADTGRFIKPADDKLLLQLLDHTYLPLRDPDSRQVYLARRTHAKIDPRGGLLTPIDNSEIRQTLMSDFAAITDGEVASAATAKAALETLAGNSLPMHKKPGLRVARSADRAIWIDLGRADEQCVRVTADGWTVAATPGAWFVRTSGIGEVPIPVQGGSLQDLWDVINVEPEDIPLIRAWMPQTLMPGNTPCPMCLLLGEQGSAKSTSAQMIGLASLDSVKRGSLSGRDITDVMITMSARWLPMLDNLRRLSNDECDSLSKIITGETFDRRALRTDGDRFEVAVRRPILATGIDVPLADDLKSRTIQIQCPVVSSRRSEDDVWAAFNKARPGIMGSVLDDLVAILSAERPEGYAPLSRMADFELGVRKLDLINNTDAVGRWHSGDERIAAEQVDGDPLWIAVAKALTGEWTGTSNQLLETIDPHRELAVRHRRWWPQSGQSMTSKLRSSAPKLRSAGWEIAITPAEKRNGTSSWRLVPPTIDGVASHVVGCRCEVCTKMAHVPGCECDPCTDL